MTQPDKCRSFWTWF